MSERFRKYLKRHPFEALFYLCVIIAALLAWSPLAKSETVATPVTLKLTVTYVTTNFSGSKSTFAGVDLWTVLLSPFAIWVILYVANTLRTRAFLDPESLECYICGSFIKRKHSFGKENSMLTQAR